jgi:heme-degrading monooxygenase HmoA
MIRHTVVLKLKYPKDSPEESEFLNEATKLSSIPGVRNFESLRQISRKNDFEYGLSMEFATKKAYEEYNQHPDHTRFVETYWVKYVEKFLEIDYEPIRIT